MQDASLWDFHVDTQKAFKKPSTKSPFFLLLRSVPASACPRRHAGGLRPSVLRGIENLCLPDVQNPAVGTVVWAKADTHLLALLAASTHSPLTQSRHSHTQLPSLLRKPSLLPLVEAGALPGRCLFKDD